VWALELIVFHRTQDVMEALDGFTDGFVGELFHVNFHFTADVHFYCQMVEN